MYIYTYVCVCVWQSYLHIPVGIAWEIATYIHECMAGHCSPVS